MFETSQNGLEVFNTHSLYSFSLFVFIYIIYLVFILRSFTRLVVHYIVGDALFTEIDDAAPCASNRKSYHSPELK